MEILCISLYIVGGLFMKIDISQNNFCLDSLLEIEGKIQNGLATNRDAEYLKGLIREGSIRCIFDYGLYLLVVEKKENEANGLFYQFANQSSSFGLLWASGKLALFGDLYKKESNYFFKLYQSSRSNMIASH